MKQLNAKFWSAAVLLVSLLTQSCSGPSGQETDKKLSIDYEKYVLDNGLEVVLHQDKSDPIVAVSILVHVGSNREKPGRTGFAHFFEHMLFQKSENIPQGGFFKNINEWGGTFNGGTWTDGTIYYEVVPKDALEKVFWMESDRMGYFINAVDIASLEGEKPVVKNEKRQRVDNQPYGHTQRVILKALYPEGHPYNWTVIGELEDLQNATIEDVKEFYETWYGPNNATLVVAGDFDNEETKAMIQKYFGEIPRRGQDTPMDPQPVTLEDTKVFYHEDNFASLPEIRLTFPTVEEYHPDSYALSALGEVLSEGKRAILNKVLVDEESIAPESGVSAYQSSNELAGTFTVRVRANSGENLDTVRMMIDQAMARFESEGFSQTDLDKIIARQETNFYNGISSVLFKAFQLASYNEYVGDPGFISEDIDKITSVKKEDVIRVYNKYIKGQNHIVTNFVPKGGAGLAMEGAMKADIVEESITEYKPNEIIEQEGDGIVVKTESSFDRAVEPPFGDTPKFSPPSIYTDQLSNGMGIYGIESNELPLVQFSIRIKGGLYVDNPEKVGSANMITDIMMKGTANKTPEELEDAISLLGSSINMGTSSEFITISGNCLAKNFGPTMDLVSEILLQPRWDSEEFERIKSGTINTIQQREVNPNSISSVVMNKMLYGKDHILSNPVVGYKETVEQITIEDLKDYYNKNFSPSVSNFHVAGAVSQSEVKSALSKIESEWASKEVIFPSYDVNPTPSEPMVYFVDIPQAKQSVIRIGRLTVPGNNPDFNQIMISNNRLGSGSSGRLFQVLREDKGFTYGAYSFASRQSFVPGIFAAASSVRSNVTKESLDTFKEVIGGYASTYTEEDLRKTKSSMIKQNTRRFETLFSLVGILQSISTYDLDINYIDKEQADVNAMTIESVQNTAEKYMDLNNMIYVIVGDKETQFDRLKVTGPGDPVLVDKYGEQVSM